MYQASLGWFLLNSHKCDPLSRNEHKVATTAIQNSNRFQFFIMQASRWYMICEYCLFCSAKIDILCWVSFVFYCSVTCLTGYISVYKLYAHLVVAGHKYSTAVNNSTVFSWSEFCFASPEFHSRFRRFIFCVEAFLSNVMIQPLHFL